MKEKSKFLSYILRHKPEEAHLTLDKEGWVAIADVVKNTSLTLDEIKQIAAMDEKGRYSIENGKIRANQGHSTKQVRMTFDRAVPPVTLYHGTKVENLARVMKEGILPMSRHHVHLAADDTDAKEVAGRRRGSAVTLRIDAKQMLADGVQFYISENGVWLVDKVDPKYIVVFERK